MFARLAVRAREFMLDLAAGTGLGSRALAPKVRAVVALDATAAMLHVGRAEAEREGLSNIVFQRGDAAALPFSTARSPSSSAATPCTTSPIGTR